jgi:hypothetical protein
LSSNTIECEETNGKDSDNSGFAQKSFVESWGGSDEKKERYLMKLLFSLNWMRKEVRTGVVWSILCEVIVIFFSVLLINENENCSDEMWLRTVSEKSQGE